jgi:hypothetical protein
MLDAYVAFQNQKPVSASTLPAENATQADAPMRDCPSWWRPCALVGAAFTQTGLRVTLGAPSHAEGVGGRADARRLCRGFCASHGKLAHVWAGETTNRRTPPISTWPAALGTVDRTAPAGERETWKARQGNTVYAMKGR